MQIVPLSDENLFIYKNLCQPYEAEFSPLTDKSPDKDGLFLIESIPNGSSCVGYLLKEGETPLGFAIATIGKEYNDVSEFYIVPKFRKKKLGYKLAKHLFDTHPGTWHIRQIEGADHAVAFWRRVLDRYVDGCYTQSCVHDKRWGMVTRQVFATKGTA